MIFLHDRRFDKYNLLPTGGITLCIEEYVLFPEGTSVVNSLGYRPIKIGIVKCSNDDLYNKKIGRELSKRNVKETEVFFERIKIDLNNCFIYSFRLAELSLKDLYYIVVNENGKVLRFGKGYN